MNFLSRLGAQRILQAAPKKRILVVGDVMLDQYLTGRVRRISPEAPVPVVELMNENYVPGGAANVARNVTALGAQCGLFGAVGRDESARHLIRLLESGNIDCGGLLRRGSAPTTLKTRIIAQHQQVVRLDREKAAPLSPKESRTLSLRLEQAVKKADAVILADYAKGMISEPLLTDIKRICRDRGIWLSCDPKPSNIVDLAGLSLLTPNRKEAFELAGVYDEGRLREPMADEPLLKVARILLETRRPLLLLVTLGEHGMLLCQPEKEPFHIPTAAQEVFDVSGAGDTVISSFTLAIVAGAKPEQAAIFSNHAAGVVVAKAGTATANPDEIRASFKM